MIGNDIVDLILAKKDSNWLRKGYLNKIFTLQEQSQITQSNFPEIMVWNLWSRKEAVYKIYNRQTGIRKFNPIQFECFDLEINTVVFENQLFYTRTQVNSEFIYSEAVVNRQDFKVIKPISRPIFIQKEDGIPSYFDDVSLSIKPLSITHHGRFERIITII